jgi:branched-chain amino acid transport system permease protein
MLRIGGTARGWRRAIALTLLVCPAAAGAALMLASPVSAAADGSDATTTSVVDGADAAGLGVIGTIEVVTADGSKRPVAGVVISVVGAGEATTADDGSFRVPVPGPGDYEVELDVATLPEGITLKAPDRNPLATTVSQDGDKRVIFPLIEGDAVVAVESSVSARRFFQLTLEGLKLGLYLAMAAIGLSLIFGTTGLVNFAHAELVSFGALMTYFFNFYGLAGVIGFLAPLPGPFGDGVNFIFATILGMVSGGVLGWAMNRWVFRPARRSGVSLLAQMLMTIGGSILLRYVFVYLFTGKFRTYRDYSAQRATSFLGLELTQKDMVAMSVSVVVLLVVGWVLLRTRTGRAMRAVSDNKDLAEASGIDVERVISQVWIFGAALAALSGAFFGFEQVKWDLGFRILLLVFAAVTLGGLGTAFGALVGALIVGVAINLSTLVIDSELKNMVALLVLVVALMVRPQGILGRRERIG